MKFEHFYITATRRCNLYCEHCLCGDPENISMNLEYVEEWLNQIDFVDNITITGGEPFLVFDDVLMPLFELLATSNKVGKFGLVTNGTVPFFSGAFSKLEKINNLLLSKNKLLSISVSNDNFHHRHSESTITFLRNIDYVLHNISVKFREYSVMGYENIIESDRAKKFGVKGGIKPTGANSLKRLYLDDEGYIRGSKATLTVKGNIVLSDILSWKQEDMRENILCKVSDFRGILSDKEVVSSVRIAQ